MRKISFKQIHTDTALSMKYLANRSTPSISCSPRRINSPISTCSPHPRCSFKNPLITTSHKSPASVFGSLSNTGSILKAANLSFLEPIGTFSGKPLTISSNLLMNSFLSQGLVQGCHAQLPYAIEMTTIDERRDLSGCSQKCVS